MKPAKLFGVESRGMVLAGDVDGAVLLQPEKKVKEGLKSNKLHLKYSLPALEFPFP